MPVSRDPKIESATNRAVLIATVCAATMIAQQVASKAMRDALFLKWFDIQSLPLMLILSAVLSIGFVLLMSRAMAIFSPAKISPIAFSISGILLAAEWLLAPTQPKLVTVLVYIHIAVLGSVLISSFWSVVNERFDPRTAKRRISRIAMGASVGGLLGGILAERFAFYFSVAAMLPVLACMQIACALLLLGLRPAGGEKTGVSIRKVLSGKVDPPKAESGFRILARVAYLRNLGLIVLLGNFAAVLLDYLLKSQVSETIEAGREQMRFFALFYTMISLATFGVQATLSRRMLEKPDNIARTVAIRPAMALVGGLFLLPGLNLVGIAIVRGMEAALHSSLFRSAYELLYNPIVPEKKRATKPIVDVGCDRLGDALGGGVAKLVLLLPVAAVSAVLVGLAMIASGIVILIARTMGAGHTTALEKSLLAQHRKITDQEKRSQLMRSLSSLDIKDMTMTMSMENISMPIHATAELGAASRSEADRDGPQHETVDRSTIRDPLIGRVADLRSGDPGRIRDTLRSDESLNPSLAPFIIPLLAWDEVTVDASITLCSIAPEITGLLLDRLLDPTEEFAIRRRIPRILGTCQSGRAVNGLFNACEDKRFEVRYRTGNALTAIQKRYAAIPIDRERVFSIVLREVQVDRRVWESERLLDRPREGDQSLFVDDVLKRRTNRSMEHVFTLLSLVLPHEPLRIAFRGLHTEDVHLRGTALEYLESVLPRKIRKSLWPFLEGTTQPEAAARSQEEILSDLLRSNPSIEMNLEDLRKKLGEQ